MENFRHYNPSEQTTQEKDPIFKKRIMSPRSYEVYEGEQEILEQWFSEIQIIYESLTTGNNAQLTRLIDTDKLRFNTKGIEPEQAWGIAQQQKFDDEGLKILAISLWLLTKRPKWKGNMEILKRFVSGEKHKLSSFMSADNEPNCLDTSIFINYFAKKFEINGEIKNTINEIRTRGLRFLHWYWQSNSGIVSDIWEGYPQLGVFKNEKEFKDKQVKDAPHLCG